MSKAGIGADNGAEKEMEISLGNTQKSTQLLPTQEYAAMPALPAHVESGTISAGTRMSEYASFRAPTDVTQNNIEANDVAARKSQYSGFPSHENNQVASVRTNYAKVDEFKAIEKQYDNAPLIVADDLKRMT